MRRKWMVLGVVTMLLAACGPADKTFSADTRWVLAAPDTFELLSLDPSLEPVAEKGAVMLKWYRVLGSVVIADGGQRKELVDAIEEAVRDSDGGVAGCFNPRHGIRA